MFYIVKFRLTLIFPFKLTDSPILYTINLTNELVDVFEVDLILINFWCK